jgi:hypothetical protein
MSGREAKLAYISGLIITGFLGLEINNEAILCLWMAFSLAVFLSFCDVNEFITGPNSKISKRLFKIIMIVVAIAVTLLSFWYEIYALLVISLMSLSFGFYTYPGWAHGEIDSNAKKNIFIEKVELDPKKRLRNYIQYFVIIGLLVVYVIWSTI